ncbi:uncharacterized protein [Procambarus clarkii]|uniref:uncharacterized protein isoform X1 n=1 Tax=Procambarus clarkii TaxID=6728 RepID=UPI003744A7C4
MGNDDVTPHLSDPIAAKWREAGSRSNCNTEEGSGGVVRGQQRSGVRTQPAWARTKPARFASPSSGASSGGSDVDGDHTSQRPLPAKRRVAQRRSLHLFRPTIGRRCRRPSRRLGGPLMSQAFWAWGPPRPTLPWLLQPPSSQPSPTVAHGPGPGGISRGDVRAPPVCPPSFPVW